MNVSSVPSGWPPSVTGSPARSACNETAISPSGPTAMCGAAAAVPVMFSSHLSNPVVGSSDATSVPAISVLAAIEIDSKSPANAMVPSAPVASAIGIDDR
jgi:hypothetical protein